MNLPAFFSVLEYRIGTPINVVVGLGLDRWLLFRKLILRSYESQPIWWLDRRPDQSPEHFTQP